MDVDEFDVYKQMRDVGASPHAVYRASQVMGLNYPLAIRMLRVVFGLDLVAAKEVTVQADHGAPSLAEHQESLVPAIRAVAEVDRRERRQALWRSVLEWGLLLVVLLIGLVVLFYLGRGVS